jgi:ADP-ribose pyrophosphatase YjhB (NUDIX family)
MREVWKPSVTVAALVERDGRFLLVEEEDAGEHVINQPAGHWEPGETLEEACAREALEESACRFVPRSLVGVYRWLAPAQGITYLRFAYAGDFGGFEEGRRLDQGIVRALWLTPAEIRASRLRTPLVWRCVEDYLAGRRYPLGLVTYAD